MKVIPTLEEPAFLSKAVVCSTGLLPCFVLRWLHIRNEKGCSPCVSSSARRLSPPPPHSLAPRPLLLSIPGTSPGGWLPSLCWGLGSYSTSQNFLDLLVPCMGEGTVGWAWNSWSFCLNRACLSSLRLPCKLWGPKESLSPGRWGPRHLSSADRLPLGPRSPSPGSHLSVLVVQEMPQLTPNSESSQFSSFWLAKQIKVKILLFLLEPAKLSHTHTHTHTHTYNFSGFANESFGFNN